LVVRAAQRLGGVDEQPEPFDYQVLGGLMKVW
jgi:hypothetical protein